MRAPVTHAAITLTASATLLMGCASVSPDAPLKRVSPDYVGAGDTRGITPMVYGARTVLQFDSLPAFVRVSDENGVTVPYERLGRYIRVSRRLDIFSVRFNLSQARFELAAPRTPNLTVTSQTPAATTTATAPVATLPAVAPKQVRGTS